MDVVPSFVADAEASKLVKPAVRAFDHPTIDSEAAAVLGVAFRQERFDAQVAQFLAVLFRIVLRDQHKRFWAGGADDPLCR